MTFREKVRICLYCGNQFHPIFRNSKNCSQKCSTEWKRQKNIKRCNAFYESHKNTPGFILKQKLVGFLYNKNNRDKKKRQLNKWRANNRDKANYYARAGYYKNKHYAVSYFQKKKTTVRYGQYIIARSSKVLGTLDIPESLGKLKLEQLKLKRLCQKLKTSTNSE